MPKGELSTDVDVSKAMGQITVRIRLHKRKRTLVRGYIADFLFRVVRWVAPWQIELVEDDK